MMNKSYTKSDDAGNRYSTEDAESATRSINIGKRNKIEFAADLNLLNKTITVVIFVHILYNLKESCCFISASVHNSPPTPTRNVSKTFINLGDPSSLNRLTATTSSVCVPLLPTNTSNYVISTDKVTTLLKSTPDKQQTVPNNGNEDQASAHLSKGNAP